MKPEDIGHTPDQPKKPHVTTFFVDNEPYTTTEQGLTVGQILELSGNTPAKNYFLVEYHGQSEKEVRHDDLNEFINIHENHRFAAGFKSETPLS